MTDAETPPRRRSLLRRIFTLPNVISVVGGLVVFAVAERSWASTQGTLLAALCGGAFSALTWLAWNRVTGLRPVGKLVDLPHIGQIPATPRAPSPTLTAPDSSASIAYQRAASRLEASTKGRVLLVSGMISGQGATTAALNLAVAATRAGRRTILIDGDTAQARLSQYGRTGIAPGLSELSRGEAGLAEASRLWFIDSTNRLPFIPAGSPSPGELDRRGLAAAVEDLTTSADLVLIDTSADGTALDALGALADGTLLVLPPAAGQGTVDAARERVDRAGAPAIGYIVNDAAPSPPSVNQHPVLRSLKRGVATALLVLLAFGAWNAVQIWSSWRGVERQGLDVAAASELLPLPDDGIADEGLGVETATAVTATPRPEGDFLAVLVVGSDLSESLADVIVLVIIPNNQADEPVMVSLPRDLYLPNRCTQSYARINASLAGCGDDVTGASLLSLTVEDFTGIHVDHFALFSFEGFERIIDEVGGVEICVENPVRDAKSHLDLPAGCTQANGEQALSWVRSRRTQEFVDDRWRTMPDVSDLTRNERQQDVILKMFAKLREFQSPSDLTGTVRSLTNAFELDDQLGITDAINLAWDLRGIDPNNVRSLEIPVTDRRTDAGADVLVPAVSFDVVLAEVWPDLAPTTDN